MIGVFPLPVSFAAQAILFALVALLSNEGLKQSSFSKNSRVAIALCVAALCALGIGSELAVVVLLLPVLVTLAVGGLLVLASSVMAIVKTIARRSERVPSVFARKRLKDKAEVLPVRDTSLKKPA